MSILSNVLQEYMQTGIDKQVDYKKFYLYSIITHSTAIEGSTVSEIENRLLFDDGIGSQKPMMEQLMNLDLKNAYDYAFEIAAKHTDYSIEMLCNLSALLMKNTGSEYNTIAGSFSSANGELRLLNVSAGRGGKSYMSWQKVPNRLELFCSWLNEERKKIDVKSIDSIYRLSFEAHYRLVHIHPWADGNGRISRLVMNMLQYEFNVVPSIVKKENRADYIKSLSESQENDNIEIFIDFMTRHHIDNLQSRIREYKESIL